MAGPSSYHRGDMDIVEQKATFQAFIAFAKWGSLAIAVGLVFFTLWLCTSANFFQAFAAAVVLTVVGVLFLREKKSSGH
jgi:hypothetical protein